MEWAKAVLKVLREANEALHYREIYQRIANEKLVDTRGKTPLNTVGRVCRDLVDKSEIKWEERGVYRINQDGVENTDEDKRGAYEDEQQSRKYPSRSYGLLWSRDKVNWEGGRKQKKKWDQGLLGQVIEGEKPNDFSEHAGIYLLHQYGRVMYVGQTSEKLYDRLFDHTKPKSDLSERWNEFSWFSLSGVQETDQSDQSMSDVLSERNLIIDLLEAVLIEVILPPLNKQAGNNLGIKYRQYYSGN